MPQNPIPASLAPLSSPLTPSPGHPPSPSHSRPQRPGPRPLLRAHPARLPCPAPASPRLRHPSRRLGLSARTRPTPGITTRAPAPPAEPSSGTEPRHGPVPDWPGPTWEPSQEPSAVGMRLHGARLNVRYSYLNSRLATVSNTDRLPGSRSHRGAPPRRIHCDPDSGRMRPLLRGAFPDAVQLDP
jgi:hypothetical protein